MPKKTEEGYKVDLRPRGRNGPRFRKVFATQGEALAYERWVMAEHATAEPWERPQVDNRRLSDLVQRWFDLHGRQLKSGTTRKRDLDYLVRAAGNPIARNFTANDFARLRAKRLDGGTVSASTANHDLAHLRAVFSELIRLGDWHGKNPLEGVRLLKVDQRELRYLTLAEIDSLLAELDKSPDSHARITARICLATGARWGEAATIQHSQVHNNQLHFVNTKTGKSRSVPIDPKLTKMILANAPLVDGINTFKRALKKLGIELPSGQLSRILRHTFASWYIMNGGNIAVLREILGHTTLAMTVRYAHLSRDHLDSALRFNPLST